jgi:hypothetical protein
MIPLNAMTALWAVLLPLVDEVPRPEDVKPGWLGFGVFLLLAAAVALLAFSFRKQIKKVDFEEKDAAAPPGEGPETRNDAAGDDGGSPRPT